MTTQIQRIEIGCFDIKVNPIDQGKIGERKNVENLEANCNSTNNSTTFSIVPVSWSGNDDYSRQLLT